MSCDNVITRLVYFWDLLLQKYEKLQHCLPLKYKLCVQTRSLFENKTGKICIHCISFLGMKLITYNMIFLVVCKLWIYLFVPCTFDIPHLIFHKVFFNYFIQYYPKFAELGQFQGSMSICQSVITLKWMDHYVLLSPLPFHPTIYILWKKALKCFCSCRYHLWVFLLLNKKLHGHTKPILSTDLVSSSTDKCFLLSNCLSYQ